METGATRKNILQYAKKRHMTEPEYLWLSSPDFAVLRISDNKKWYGVVMNIPRERLGLSGSGEIDVLNVKCEPVITGSLRKMPGFLPAYHMSKASWISVLLDSTVPFADVTALLDMSFELVGKAKARPTKKGVSGGLE